MFSGVFATPGPFWRAGRLCANPSPGDLSRGCAMPSLAGFIKVGMRGVNMHQMAFWTSDQDALTIVLINGDVMVFAGEERQAVITWLAQHATDLTP